jgi:hypothetical protein
MNYWLTTHWPPYEGDKEDHGGVYLPDGRAEAGKEMQKGDLIFIYQSLNGRDRIETYISGKKKVIKSTLGKMQVISLVRATSPIKNDSTIDEIEYVDGSKIRWSWYADTEHVSTNGFASLEDVNRVLGYSQNYNLRGFGDKKSGLKKLTKKQFDELLKIFNSNSNKKPRKKKVTTSTYGGLGGESEEHKKLKNKIAKNPSKYLNEEGLKTIEVEYSFPSGDRADIVLKDKFGRIIGVEIEISQDENNHIGVLQAIKYRYMLAYMFSIDFKDTRSMLVAHSISNGLKKNCKGYEVECFEVS